MMALMLAGLASLILLSVAISLLMKAGAKPPVAIRTESHRSPAEYDYHRKAASLRKRGHFYLLAGAASLAVCVMSLAEMMLSGLN